MSQPRGRTLPLSVPRRLTGDLLAFAQQIPSIPVERTMHLGSLVVAREAAVARPGWAAIFTKAYACVCAAYPELRRAYLTFPWPHLYEHPVNVAMIAIERDLGDEKAVLFGSVKEPENWAITQIDTRLRRYKTAPVQTVGTFRRLLRISRWPTWIRRCLWWYGLNVSGRKRESFFGTFGLSSYGSLGASSLHPRSVLTSTLTYGPIAADGTVVVRLIYDHRVLDGSTVARALADLERILTNELTAEVERLPQADVREPSDAVEPAGVGLATQTTDPGQIAERPLARMAEPVGQRGPAKRLAALPSVATTACVAARQPPGTEMTS
jgi:hypothetical protein